MATHEIPRNVKGEGRILMIFSTKSLIYTAIAAVIGVIFFWLFKQIGLEAIGIGILVVFALIGYVIGMFKIPEIDSLKFTKKVDKENIDDVIKRAILFKMKKNKIYAYTREEDE